MKRLLVEYLQDFLSRGDEIAYAHQRGLRTYRWTYREVATLALRFSLKLDSLQINKGDRLIICAENSAEWVALFMGCLMRGVIVVPLDVESERGFFQRVQTRVEAKLVVLDETTQKSLQLDLPFTLLEELTLNAPQVQKVDLEIPPNVEEDDLVEIIFTSGTTAEPKGVRITNRNLMSNLAPLEKEIQRYLKWERLVHPVRFLNLLPLSHIFGQFMGVFVPQLLGGEVFFQPSLKSSQIINTIKRERISVLVCVPRMLEILRERIEREYASSSDWLEKTISRAKKLNAVRRWWLFRKVHRLFGLKFWAFISGGATLPSEVEEFWQRLGFVVIQGYGMTETASLISVNHPFRQGRGSIGKIMTGQEVKLEDGEILVRGQNISPGYWKESDRSANSAGWLRTGDLGEFDEAGNLYFKGRKKDVIVTAAGLNIYPQDIEQVLNDQHDIRAGVVIPFAGPFGPEPFAVLIPTGPQVKIPEVLERVNTQLASHQRVFRWYIWPEQDFPRTSTGKIKKHLLAAAIKEAMAGQPKSARVAGGLQEIISRVGGEAAPDLGPAANLEQDLKLDSLGRVELLSEIEERYQLELSEAAFSSASTVADVQKIISERQVQQVAEYPYPHWPHRFPLKWLRLLLLYTIVFPLTRIMGRARVKGAEKVEGRKSPILFVANHLTMVDHALVLWAMPGSIRRRMAIAMDGEILRDWLNPPEGTSWFLRQRFRLQYFLVALFFNVFSMPHQGSFRRSFEYAGEMVDRGFNIMVFPEGRRSPDGQLQPFKAGIGLLVSGLKIPVVPVRIEGLYEVARQGRYFAPAGAISVTIGEPIRFATQEAEVIAAELERKFRI